MRYLINKYNDIILYLFFGVCSTVVNIVTYWVCSHPLHVSYLVSTIIAWSVSVSFAYLTNRKWVFRSDIHEIEGLYKEFIKFISCRIASGIVDFLIMLVFVEIMRINDVIIKIIANVIVIILNYLASRLIIFTKVR